MVGDIRANPRWYARILYKRAKRIFTEATPVRVAWWDGWYTVLSSPKSGKLFMTLLMFAFAARVRFMRNLLLFTLPTCATAFLIYSDRGVAWYGIFHLVSTALWIMVAWAGVESVVLWAQRRERLTAAQET